MASMPKSALCSLLPLFVLFSPPRLASLCLLLLLSTAAAAAEDWSLCAVPALTPATPASPDRAETEVTADLLFSEQRDVIEFRGDVEVLRASQTIRADYLTLLQNPQRMSAKGNVAFSDTTLKLSADDMALDSESDYSLFHNASFTLYENHLRGTTARLEQKNSFQREFDDVRYTTCDPGRNDWSLAASRLLLDDETGMGTAHHAVLRIGPVPVFYFPWFRFPITNERMSGFLPPLIAGSSDDGSLLTTPFYWNLADNYDMTITPALYSKRGLMLNTENRYLLDNTQGEIRLSDIDDDITGRDRSFRYWKQDSSWDSGISVSILRQRVSDVDFAHDFRHAQKVEDVDFLKSMVRVSARLGEWDGVMMFDEHQTLIPNATAASDQYKRVPQLTLSRNFTLDDGTPWLKWNSEYVKLDHEVKVRGERLRIYPTLSYPIEGDYYFLTPSLQLDASQYRLQDNPAGVDNIERSLPLASIDSGLFFERLLDDQGRWLQTLEPRLYLLYAPYRDQTDIPLFDSALQLESFDGLFRNNRFSGGDRIGDSQQVSFALSSRFIDQDDGREVFSIAMGQAFYQAQRRVNLGNRVDDERDKSGVITRIRIRPDPWWKIDMTRIYNQASNEADQNSVSIQRVEGGTVFNLEYHLRRDEMEQSTVALVYPLSPAWNVFMKEQRSILHDRPVQNLAGFSYESCCWRFDLLYQEESDTLFEATDRSVSFQFTFKGFGGAGNDIDSVLEDGILGYSPSR